MKAIQNNIVTLNRRNQFGKGMLNVSYLCMSDQLLHFQNLTQRSQLPNLVNISSDDLNMKDGGYGEL